MTNNTRGWLMALAAVAAFVGVTQLTLRPLRHPAHAGPDSPPGEVKGPAFGDNPTMCAALAAQYQRQWAVSASCSEDDQCVAERRTPTWSGTDECFRFRNKSAENGPADLTARMWHGHGCLDPQLAAHQACPVTLEVQCRRDRCIPRSGTASGWKRVVLPDVARLLLPADFEVVNTDEKHKQPGLFFRQLDGKGRSLTVQTTHEGTPLSAASLTDKSTKVVGQQSVTIDGYPTALWVVEDRLAAGKPGAPARHFRAITELVDAGVQGNRLVFELTCETRAHCDALAAIVDQADLLVTAPGPRPERDANH